MQELNENKLFAVVMTAYIAICVAAVWFVTSRPL